MWVMQIATSPPRGRVIHSFTFALTISLARQNFARFCGDIPNRLHHAHHSRILQTEREHVLPYSLIVNRVPVQQLPSYSRTLCNAFAATATAGNNAIVVAFALGCHCLSHCSCRRELLRNGEGEKSCCDRGRIFANAKRIEEQERDGRCVWDLKRYN